MFQIGKQNHTSEVEWSHTCACTTENLRWIDLAPLLQMTIVRYKGKRARKCNRGILGCGRA